MSPDDLKSIQQLISQTKTAWPTLMVDFSIVVGIFVIIVKTIGPTIWAKLTASSKSPGGTNVVINPPTSVGLERSVDEWRRKVEGRLGRYDADFDHLKEKIGDLKNDLGKITLILENRKTVDDIMKKSLETLRSDQKSLLSQIIRLERKSGDEK